MSYYEALALTAAILLLIGLCVLRRMRQTGYFEDPHRFADVWVRVEREKGWDHR